MTLGRVVRLDVVQSSFEEVDDTSAWDHPGTGCFPETGQGAAGGRWNQGATARVDLAQADGT